MIRLEAFGGLVGSALALAAHVQLKAWERLRLARLANPLVLLGVCLPQLCYLAATDVARKLPALRGMLEKLSYAPRGYGMILRRPAS
jgi:hypothetical protein